MTEAITGYHPAPLDPVRIRAAVERDASFLGDPVNGQTARLNRRLEREVVPWSNQDMQLGRFGSVTAITNPDPILNYAAHSDESEWRKMERDPTVYNAKQKRVNRLLSFGSELSRPDRETPANKIIHEAVLLNLKSIQKLGTVLRCALDAVYWGWRPMEATYKRVLFKGRPIWVQHDIREKNPEEFAFTIDRELMWHGGSYSMGSEVVFNRRADPFKWFVSTSGSTNNPYGNALYRAVWLPAYLLARFDELLATGVQRSVGIVKVTNSGGGTSKAGSFMDGVSPSINKTAAEVVEETRNALKVLNDYGILGTIGGMMIELVTDVKAVEAWIMPVDKCKQEIELAVTGQTLTSKIDGNGSRAAAETHMDVLDFNAKSDAQETEQPFVNDGLIARFLELNFGEVDPEDVPKWRSKIGSQVSLDAAEKLWNMGAALDGGRVAQDAGVPLAEGQSGEKVVLKKAEPVQASAGEQGKLPFGKEPAATSDKPPKKEARRA